MKYIFTLAVLIISACDSSNIETIKIGSKETEYLYIKDFSNNLKAKNIILVIGDGTGLNQITLSRLSIGGPDHRLFIDQLPYQGLSLTHAHNNLITDSAAAASAWATGFKTNNRFLSITPEKKILETLPEMLDKKGYSSGLVATSSITHATPAAFYAHIDSRYKEDEIANQLISSPIDIALGGGQEFFDLQKVKQTHELFLKKQSLIENFGTNRKIIGLFDQDGINRSNEKPTQQEMTAFALSYLQDLSQQCYGFFLMTEGSQIDWAGHDNNAQEMIEEFKDFDTTIKDLINFVTEDEDTLLVITADHETGGLQILKQDNDSVSFQWGTTRHTGVPVGVYSYGPGAHLFNGMMDNTEIHYKILEAIDFSNLDQSICNNGN